MSGKALHLSCVGLLSVKLFLTVDQAECALLAYETRKNRRQTLNVQSVFYQVKPAYLFRVFHNQLPSCNFEFNKILIVRDTHKQVQGVFLNGSFRRQGAKVLEIGVLNKSTSLLINVSSSCRAAVSGSRRLSC